MSWFMKFKCLADTERHYTWAGVVLYFCLPEGYKSNMPSSISSSLAPNLWEKKYAVL